MDAVQGTSPMPDPLKVLDLRQLIGLYGMLERASHRLTAIAYLSNWDYAKWQGLVTDLEMETGAAYGEIMHRLGSSWSDPDFFYSLPTRREWLEDKLGESD